MNLLTPDDFKDYSILSSEETILYVNDFVKNMVESGYHTVSGSRIQFTFTTVSPNFSSIYHHCFDIKTAYENVGWDVYCTRSIYEVTFFLKVPL